MKTFRKIGETKKTIDNCRILSAKSLEREKNIENNTRPSELDFSFNYSGGVV